MPNFAKVLKDEIARVSRKEQRGDSAALKKASSTHRSEIAALKRRVAALEQLVKRLAKTNSRTAPGQEPPEAGPKHRFSAARLKVQRERLGISAAEMGVLVGVSGQSIYHWEAGKSRPRASQLAAIAKARAMGKREVVAALEAAAGA